MSNKPAASNVSGTSPRTRGKLEKASDQRDQLRNIPAHAGKTSCQSSHSSTSTEHPRARGENISEVIQLQRTTGTSPRTRGKLPYRRVFPQASGNIPAHAGKTTKLSITALATQEHPRARGENDTFKAVFEKLDGTSPRTRGKHLLTCGSSFLRVILHSVLFFCTVGVPWNPPSSLLSECFSDRIVVYDQPGTSLLSAYGCAFWWDGE